MNFQRVSIQVQLDFQSIPYIQNIQDDPRYVQWNRLKKSKMKIWTDQINLYRNPQFRFPHYVKFKNEIQQEEHGDNQTQIDTKQYKKKKIVKIDRFHIKTKSKPLKNQKPSKSKQQNKKYKKKISYSYQLPSDNQQKRKKYLNHKYKRYRTTNNNQNTGKKQPKQFNSSKQSIYNKKPKKQKILQQLDSNYLNDSSIISRSRTRRRNIIQTDHDQQSDQIQEESYEQISNKKSKRKKSYQKKRPNSESKSKKDSNHKSCKTSYLLQHSLKNKQLREKFNQQVLEEVPGRMNQADKIFQLILNAQNGSSTPICLHGNTGCGKTSLITKMLTFIMKQFPKNFSTAYLNCMTMWSVNHVYSGILYKLFGMKQKRSERALNNLFQYSQQLALSTKSISSSIDVSSQIQKTKIIVLDQIDHFIKDQTFIYNLLEWTHIKNSKIILIMISNILDLSVNLSAKIQSRMKFQSLVFKPYSPEAIQQILKYKYPEATRIMQPQAIIFLCRKVASINSDIRLLQKIYEDVITQWSQINGLVEKDESQNEQDCYNMGVTDRDIYDDESSQKLYPQRKPPRSQKQQRKQLIQSLLRLSRTKKLCIFDIQKSLFLTGELNNQQLPQIIKEYQIILKVLHKAKKKEQVSYEIMNKTFLKQNKMPSSQQLFLLMCELKDMGLIQFKQNTKNCDATFQGFGIKINQPLHLMCPED